LNQPLGCGIFADCVKQPREWVERTANVTYFARHEFGGHFPALTVPDVILGHIREMFA
jgi:hypothetical protein